ncbi:hypothetical protein K501DRAFT_325515 [Backusella circina FSU 941]|nr:hypothetical protein K501DRAFT_325515 [Backusella circina FSU 941]
MALFSNKSRTCCGFIPIRTGVYLITIFGLLNKLSGFYGLISLEYNDKIALCAHIYSLIALGVFGYALYGITKDKYKVVRWFTLFYWLDFLISNITTIYFAVQWFVYTDHSLPELENDPEGKLQHDETFRAESIVSIVCLCVIRITHFYFAYILTSYYVSMGQSQYSKLAAQVDEELEFAGYDEQEMQEEDDNNDDDDTRPLTNNNNTRK